MGLDSLAPTERIMQRWTLWCYRRGPRLAIAIFALAALALVYAATHLRVNTSARDMINPALDYRQAELAFEAQFPALNDLLIVRLAANTEVEADLLAEILKKRLEDDPLIDHVFAPDIDPFFIKNSFLYLDEAALDSTITALNKAAPFLRALGSTPTLDQYFASLADGLNNRDEPGFPTALFEDIISETTRILTADPNTSIRVIDWQRLLVGRTTTAKKESDGFTAIRLMQISPVYDFQSLHPAREIVHRVKAAVASVRKDTALRATIGITGTQALRTEELQTVTQGIVVALTLSLVLVAFVLWRALLSGRLVAIALAILLASLSFSLAFAAAFAGPLNLVSVAFVVLLVGLGIDFLIHVSMDALDQLTDGQSRPDALAATIRTTGPGLFLAALSSALTFLAFVPTDFIGMAQLGVISAAGILIAFIASITLLPALFDYVPRPVTRRTSSSAIWSFTFSSPPYRSALILASLAIFCMPFAARISFNADPMNLRNAASPSVITFKVLASSPDTTPYRLNAVVSGYETAARLAAEARQHPLIAQAYSLTSFIPHNQADKLDLIDFSLEGLASDLGRQAVTASADNAGGRDVLLATLGEETKGHHAALKAALKALPADSAAAEARFSAGLFGQWDALITSLSSRLAPDAVTLDTLPASLKQRYVSLGGGVRVEFIPSQDMTKRANREAFLAAVQRFHPSPTGPLRVYLDSSKVIAQSMLTAGLGAGLAVLLLLAAFTLKPKQVFAVLIPQLVGTSLIGAAAYTIGLSLNFANVIVVPLVIGLGVDSAIHLALRRSNKGEQAFHIFQTSTPRAVFYSALTTILTFASLGLSDHPGTASMGLLLMLSIAIILVVTTVMVPCISALLNRKI